jgi:hypothetical protein
LTPLATCVVVAVPPFAIETGTLMLEHPEQEPTFKLLM